MGQCLPSMTRPDEFVRPLESQTLQLVWVRICVDACSWDGGHVQAVRRRTGFNTLFSA